MQIREAEDLHIFFSYRESRHKALSILPDLSLKTDLRKPNLPISCTVLILRPHVTESSFHPKRKVGGGSPAVLETLCSLP
ncbi:hypothetical protein AV530_006301 [Patagioenas fasciata monilis]|uniref:Uncharacterized protein n=1 Tax=Patagioenas fasciata monilis TaxID=372326 RepID=A0A1V4KG02_PATFA|nr:hypothetical protein AV530_006301 [Patagioenas fasciata monilis]